MRKLKLYIAVSVDGFIAGAQGELDWLDNMNNPYNLDHGYAEFYDSIDTTIMGNTTYKTILGITTDFPYKEKVNYVVSRLKHRDNEYVSFIGGDLINQINTLKQAQGKDIWLIGGGQLMSFLLNHHLIDEMRICIIPIVLGDGIRLFQKPVNEEKLRLSESRVYETGALQLIYFPEVD